MHYIFVLHFLFWEQTGKIFNFCGALPHFPFTSFGEYSVAEGSSQHLNPTEKKMHLKQVKNIYYSELKLLFKN